MINTQGSLLDVIDQEKRSRMTWRPEDPPSLDGIDEIQLDTETDGLKWYDNDRPIGIALGYRGRYIYLPWGHEGGGNLDEAVVKRWAQRELRGKLITNLNTRFDIHMMHSWGIDLEAQGCRVSDVAHYAALLDDHRRRFSLDALAQDYLGEGKTHTTDSGDEFDITQMKIYHAGEVAAYACKDVELIDKLKKVMWPKLDEEDLQEVRQLEDDVIFPVCEMERNGCPIDVEKLNAWAEEVEQKSLRLLYQVHKEYGLKVHPEKSSDWIKVYEYCKIPITKFTETGIPKFSDDVIRNETHPLIVKFREVKLLNLLFSKYLGSYQKCITSDGRLRYNLNQLKGDDYGTISGRFSSSGDRGQKNVPGAGKNIQQVMAVDMQVNRFGGKWLIRELFIPRVGRWLSADANQIEYRLFAHYASSSMILQKYAENPHLNYHEVVKEMMAPFRSKQADERSTASSTFTGVSEYQKAKTINFAKLYGAGKKRIADTLGLSLRDSARFILIYDNMFPEQVKLLEQAVSVATQRGYVKTIMGRRGRFPGGERTHKALNTIIQGSAADIMKKKLVLLHAERAATGFVMRLTLHDEVCGDSPDERCTQMVEDILNEQSFDVKVPILWEVTSGENWAEWDLKKGKN
jgi:DNA polymerase-1